MQQQYCVRWNNHLKIFQTALPKYFQNQKFLDVTLVVEDGKHLVPCHKMVLDACSDYFANFLKNKLLEDKNLVICLPKEIRLWEIQAILQFMYHGEVCISQEGLPSLVKCAEMLQVKGLCGNETTSITSTNNNSDTSQQVSQLVTSCNNEESETNESPSKALNGEDAIEIDETESECEFNGQMRVKRELSISDNENANVEDDMMEECETEQNSSSATITRPSTSVGLIRVKRNLFENATINNDLNKSGSEIKTAEEVNKLIYNKNSMDIYVKAKNSEGDVSRSSSPLLRAKTPDGQYESIVCSPTLLHYISDDGDKEDNSFKSSDHADDMVEEDDDDDIFIEQGNICTNDALYELISKNFVNGDQFSLVEGNGTGLNSNLLISSVSSLNQQLNEDVKNVKIIHKTSSDKKVAISGLYLRNPRGNQVRQYDVNALYSALQDVKNGHSIYRAAQTYNIPRKTLRNWMKRLSIKSQYPMPKQLAQAAERKKTLKKSSTIIMKAI